MYLPNINSLKTINPLPNPLEEFIVAGHFTSGDGGGGTFTWVPVSTQFPLISDDGGIIIRSTIQQYQNAGYFKRIFSGPVNVRWFGAKGDGSTDDTVAVHKARDAAKVGTVYFPQSIDQWGAPMSYKGAFVFHTHTGIMGDGIQTILQTNGSGAPVLTLGSGHPPYGTYKPMVSKIQVSGLNDNDPNPQNHVKYSCDGVYFDDSIDPNGAEYAGRWIFEEVTFIACNKAVHKPKGNIGNVFDECWWHDNKFAYYAKGFYNGSTHKEMHAGCDKFLGGNIELSKLAGIYVDAGGNEGYGQLIVDGTSIESNPGFGILVKLSSTSSNRMTITAVELRNVWTERNCMPVIYSEMNGGNVVSSTPSQGKGIIEGRFDPISNILYLTISFENLTYNTTGAELHFGTPGNNGALITNLLTYGFPTGIKTGSWSGTVSLTSAEALDLLAGNYYIIIKSNPVYPNGEIRGQLPAVPNVVIDGNTYSYLSLQVCDYYFE